MLIGHIERIDPSAAYARASTAWDPTDAPLHANCADATVGAPETATLPSTLPSARKSMRAMPPRIPARARSSIRSPGPNATPARRREFDELVCRTEIVRGGEKVRFVLPSKRPMATTSKSPVPTLVHVAANGACADDVVDARDPRRRIGQRHGQRHPGRCQVNLLVAGCRERHRRQRPGAGAHDVDRDRRGPRVGAKACAAKTRNACTPSNSVVVNVHGGVVVFPIRYGPS